MRNLTVLGLATVLAGCSSLTPADDPVYLRITDIEARLIRLERVLENESLISLASDISSLRTEVQALLGEVETLRFEVDGQADGNRSLYLNLDERLAELEAAQERMRSMPAVGGQAPVAAVTDQQAYDAAFALIGAGDYAGAQRAFESFLATYLNSTRRFNAQYWLAEAHYAQLEFQTALAEFQRVLDNYPQSNKVPDALLKIGYTQQQLGNLDAARRALRQVIGEYPGTDAASLAEGRLSQIGN